jgi:hypothetical protein
MIPEFKAFPYQVDDLVKASPSVSLKNARVALLTSGGLYLKDRQSSFDLDRERQEPFWGDPTYRLIPRDVRHGEIAVADLHLNPMTFSPTSTLRCRWKFLAINFGSEL